MQAVRRAGSHESAGPSEDLVGERHDAEDRNRRRNADSTASFRRLDRLGVTEGAGDRAIVAGLLARRVGTVDSARWTGRRTRASATPRRLGAESRDDEAEGGLPAEERRPVQ